MIDELLKTVPWLSEAGDLARAEVAARAQPVSFPPGKALIVELEAGGDEIYILTEGRAAVTVTDGRSIPRAVAELGPGDVCGELSMLTREVRSASVTAASEGVKALRLSRNAFERILDRHPDIGAHFVKLVAQRIVETRKRLTALAYPVATAKPDPRRNTVSRAWTELVTNHSLELPTLTLTAFLATLVCLRAGAKLTPNLLDYLRGTYTFGFVLVFAGTAASLLRFRRKVQRAVALALGIGIGAIVNGLSVFLAFDTFYLDMTTRDEAIEFSVETLYQRNESDWAVLIVILILLQLIFLRKFYRRVWLIARLRATR